MTTSTPPTVLVVRPRAQAQRWVEALAARGVAARALPLIEIGPAPDAARVRNAWQAMRAAVTSSLPPVVVFVSPNAVSGFFDAIRSARVESAPVSPSHADDSPWPAGANACAAGPGTAAALVEAGVPAELVTGPAPDAPQIDSEALWSGIAAWPWMGRPVWIVRGNGGREWLAERLREVGAHVEIVQSYERLEPRLDDDETAALHAAVARPEAWIWMFGSSEAITNLQAVAPDAAWHRARALASHPRIVERARAAGFGRVEAVAPTVDAVVDALHDPGVPGRGT